ncbi:MAG: hypothetical protein ACLGI3_15730 [Actinomycetes bacterium]
MSAVDRSTPRSGRARHLRDDLLDDLRRAAPMPTAPPTPHVSRTVAPVGEPADRPATARPGTAAFELRVTPRLWTGLRVRLRDGGGLVLDAGPVQLSLTGLRH